MVMLGSGVVRHRPCSAGGRRLGGAVKPLTMSTQLSFRLAGPARPIILVPTFVNGRGPYEFALDTGAAVTVLSPELAAALGLTSAEAREGMGAGGKIQVGITSIQSLAVGTAGIENLQAAIADLSGIGKAAGVRLDGIIGHNYLRHFVVTIDYPACSLRLDSKRQES